MYNLRKHFIRFIEKTYKINGKKYSLWEFRITGIQFLLWGLP